VAQARRWYDVRMASESRLEDQALAQLDALYNFARRLSGTDVDAEELVQETFARALAARSRFDGANVRAWLFRILRNEYIDGWRKRKNDPARATLDEDLDGPIDADLLRDDIEIDALRRVVAKDIEAALATLGDDARAVILLDLEGLSEAEIADVMGCAQGTVKSRLSRARLALRQRLKEYAR
jgi:RNA polymerase sigma-70 factor (ECF subfamily)